MNVLWITFTMFPEALNLMGNSQKHKGSGGWLFNYAESLLDTCGDLTLRVAIVNNLIPNYQFVKGERIGYYLIPFGKGFNSFNHGYDAVWKRIKKEFNPDVVHVHGIETSLALTYMKACGPEHVVCSIQGLPNIISRYLLHGTSRKEILRNITIRDVLRCNNYLSLVKNDKKKDGLIKETMMLSNNFIGRTEWDKAHIWAVNPKASYFFCNETLRKGFYLKRWEYCKCVPHTVFVSATKGIHNLIKALPIVQREYPDLKVMVATGGNLFQPNRKKRLMMTGYEYLIRRQIHSLHLDSCVCFLGPLTEEQMVDNYLKANVFVSPSTCENSSNSVCEAQLLGVPVVASYVGGMHDLIPDKSCGKLFRCEEYEMLAKFICDYFENANTFDNTAMRERAMARHDALVNANRTIEIYKAVQNQQ